MITVITGTNRKNSKSSIIAKACQESLEKKGIKCNKLALEDIPMSHYDHGYDQSKLHEDLIEIQEKMIFPVEKSILVVPMYNGSYPGVVKTFLDAISLREYPRNFKGKKMLIVGVSSGREGNLRGIDDLSTTFLYLGTSIFPNKLSFPLIGQITDETSVTDNASLTLIDNTLEAFLKY